MKVAPSAGVEPALCLFRKKLANPEAIEGDEKAHISAGWGNPTASHKVKFQISLKV